MTQSSVRVRTERLELVPSEVAIARAAHEDRVALGELLGCAVSARWPPSFIAPLLEPVADTVESDQSQCAWCIWYAIDRSEHLLIGNVAFQGPPEGGTVEIVYAMADDSYGKGYATEAVDGLSAWALEQPNVVRVIALVDAADAGADSARAERVLEKAGFSFVAEEAGGVKAYERRG